MPRLLDGPRVAARSGQTRQLVVLLHGYGADGHDLIDLAGNWASLLPDAAFVSPHAPEPCGGAPTGRQWWELTFRDPNERWRGVQKAAPDLDHFLVSELQRHGLGPQALGLVGFSQGAMMAMHVGLRQAVPPAAIVAYSGHLVGPEKLREEAKGTPPLLLVHGDQDAIIPVDALFESMGALGKAEIPCQWHLSFGIGHGIDQGGLRHGGMFLAQGFGLSLPREL